MRRCIYVFSHHKMDSGMIPAPLQDIPNITYVEEAPVDVCPDQYVQTGCKILIPETISLQCHGAAVGSLDRLHDYLIWTFFFSLSRIKRECL